MIVNFDIEDHYALNYGGRHIDLHNNFNFASMSYDAISRELKLNFIRTKGDWVKEDELQGLWLTHTNVFRLIVNYDNKARQFPNDDLCLSDITFFPSVEMETNDRVTLEAKPSENDDIIYMFQSGYVIRVGCDKIELLINE